MHENKEKEILINLVFQATVYITYIYTIIIYTDDGEGGFFLLLLFEDEVGFLLFIILVTLTLIC